MEKHDKKVGCYLFLVGLIIAILIYCIYFYKPKKAESAYLQGSWYLNYPPDPYPNFPDSSL